MKSKYLFPHKYKNIGWLIFIPSVIFGIFTVVKSYEPDFLNINVPAFFIDDGPFGGKAFFDFISDNILNEVLGILIILSGLLVAFSKEKFEDEYIAKIRLESLVWATYINYGILILAFIFVYSLSFLWVMLFNMFTILIIFIIRFNWLLSKSKIAVKNEE